MRSRKVALALAIAAAGCSNGTGTDTGPGEDPDDPPVAGDPDAAAPEPVRFIMMGDVGTGSDDQYKVAEAIKNKCDADGCDFVVLLGDNIYNAGVSSVDDAQWREKFEQPYGNIELPFYAVLGNHDYGGIIGVPPVGVESGGLGNEWNKGPIEVQYTAKSDKWNMPATHYTMNWGNVGFIMLDTNSILWGDTTNGDQKSWYSTALMEVEGADWVIQAGHHPYISNGSHGNAGNYEAIELDGVDVDLDAIPVPIGQVNGEKIKKFFDETVCGTVDLSVSGHDHNRQWLDEPGALCGAEMIVNGAGAKVKDFEPRGNEFHWQDADTEGFLYVHVEGNVMTGQFINKNGTVDYERTLTK